ncbi:MAG: hypothetical protein ABI571_03220 [Actinomycetota bacterium]
MKSIEQILLTVRRIGIEERLDRMTSCQQGTLEIVLRSSPRDARRSTRPSITSCTSVQSPPLEHPHQGPDQRIQMPVEVGRLDPIRLPDACQPRGPDLVPVGSKDLGKTPVAGGPQGIGCDGPFTAALHRSRLLDARPFGIAVAPH